ncbi:Exosome complex component Csl4 [uncultured archaeon]|nr:Exosome complex component Csl4 [uncultured archaeon]
MAKQDIVVPGDFLGFEEEFVAGQDAHEGADGGILASTIGLKALDNGGHEASVKRLTRQVRIMERGCIVHAIVNSIKTNAALVTILDAEKDGEFRTVHNAMASIAVFNIDTQYIRGIDEMFRAGDIVRARVMEVTPYGVELTTKEPQLGVVKAYGIKSRQPLHLIDGKLRDPVTGDTETRKVSSDYALK